MITPVAGFFETTPISSLEIANDITDKELISRKLIQYNSKKIAMNKKVTSPKQIRFTDTRIKAKHFCKHFIQSAQQEKFR